MDLQPSASVSSGCLWLVISQTTTANTTGNQTTHSYLGVPVTQLHRCVSPAAVQSSSSSSSDWFTDWLTVSGNNILLLACSLSPNVLWMSLSLWFPHSPPLAHSVSLPSSFLFLWHTLQMLNTREREPKGSTVNCNCLLERKGGKKPVMNPNKYTQACYQLWLSANTCR